MSRPEFPKPSVGDELIVYRPAGRYTSEEKVPVRVKAMARFRVTLEGPDGEDLPWHAREFDIRSQLLWDASRRDNRELHTPETLEYRFAEKRVEGFLQEHGLYVYQFRGALRKKVNEDPRAFVNLLLRWIGEEEI